MNHWAAIRTEWLYSSLSGQDVMVSCDTAGSYWTWICKVFVSHLLFLVSTCVYWKMIAGFTVVIFFFFLNFSPDSCQPCWFRTLCVCSIPQTQPCRLWNRLNIPAVSGNVEQIQSVVNKTKNAMDFKCGVKAITVILFFFNLFYYMFELWTLFLCGNVQIK